MTKYQAQQRAHSMWGGPDRYGCVVLRQKKHPKRHQVGWQLRALGHEAPTPWTMMGAGDSWEEAFSNARNASRFDADGHIRECGNGGDDPENCSSECFNARAKAGAK